jgi:hypothetical protein
MRRRAVPKNFQRQRRTAAAQYTSNQNAFNFFGFDDRNWKSREPVFRTAPNYLLQHH